MDVPCPSKELTERMLATAEDWANATTPRRSLPGLADKVISSSQFFDRVRDGRDITLRNFCRIVRHLVDPENWPGGVLPPSALSLAEVPLPAIDDDTPPPDAGDDDSDGAATAAVETARAA